MPDTYRVLSADQRSQIWTAGPEHPETQLLLETDELLVEAPNWSLDGNSLYVNGNGELYRIDVHTDQPVLEAVVFVDLPALNNDHVLDPDGQHIYMSAMDGHIYRGALIGGAVDRVTPDDGYWHFLHGVSPDGSRLAYVQLREFGMPGQLVLLEPDGEPKPVSMLAGHLDGPEWSPDGQWLYFNTEGLTRTPGHAQLARMPDPVGVVEQLVASDTVDWFPHLSPDSRWASYIAFPPGTIGHPADLHVEVRIVRTDDWSDPVQRFPVFGGQGTINVNSWAPDSSRIAFVAYPCM